MARFAHPVADVLERLASPLARERQKRVQREEIARLDAAEQRTQDRSHIGAVLKARGQAHLDLAHVHIADEVLHEIGLGLALGKNL